MRFRSYKIRHDFKEKYGKVIKEEVLKKLFLLLFANINVIFA